MLDVTDFGVIADGVADDTAGMLAARDAYQTNSDFRGGKIRLPKGRIMMAQPLPLTSYKTGMVHNLIFEGDGEQATLLDFSRCAAGTDGVSADEGGHLAFRDFTIFGAKRHNLKIGPAKGSSSFANFISLSNLRLQGAGGAGLYSSNAWNLTVDRVWTRDSPNGAIFAGFHTTADIRRLYCNGHSGSATEIDDMVQSRFTACAWDNSTWGVGAHNIQAAFDSCGGEGNQRDLFLFRTSNALSSTIPAERQNVRVSLNDCWAYNNSLSAPTSYGNFITAATADNRPIYLSIHMPRVLGTGKLSMVLAGASGTVKTKETMIDGMEGTVAVSGSVVRT